MLILQHEEKSFVSWMRETNNVFTGDEYHFRLGIWLTNKRIVQDHNRANLGFTLALNHFAHLTRAEYESMLGFIPSNKKTIAIGSNYKAPESIDWREKGVVNPIQSQGGCGSCWAFAGCFAQESQYAIVHGELQKLSEQNFVDCDEYCHGCNGGNPDLVFDYAIYNQKGKFMLESDYPYTSYEGKCQFNAAKGVSNIKSYITCKWGNETDLALKVAQYGPATAAVNASPVTFLLYSGGIYDDPACSPTPLNHAVGVCGYGVEGEKKYWIIRSHSGEKWGEKGYMRLIKDAGNRCGVALSNYIPQCQ